MLQDLYRTFVLFETHAQRFDTTVLIASGLVLLVAGIIIWLAGISFSRVISSILAGLTALLAAIILTGGSPAASVLACVTGVIAGAILQRLVLSLCASTFIALCLFIGTSTATGVTMKMSLSSSPADAPTLTAAESWQRTRTFAEDLRGNFISISRKQSYKIYVFAIGVFIASFIGTMFFREFGAALACSALGALMGLTGLLSLLFYKGAQPVEYIGDHGILIAGIMAGMLLFGVIVQLLLTRPRKGKKVIVVQQPAKQTEEHEPVKTRTETISVKPTENWRTS